MNRMMNAALGLSLAAGLLRAEQPKIEMEKEVRALHQTRSLESAAEAYYTNPQSGNKYPETLTDLITPSFGGASFLKNGPADLVDPWGKTYQYATRKHEKG